MLFNEPKLLKSVNRAAARSRSRRFSALQRAEIAEIRRKIPHCAGGQPSFSALQRAEIAEILELLQLRSC